ncbi:endonuclease/exonuclease/phosphatase family metal-dependent hydrolase [Sulfitobacter undariae]|uniref:Endonuclease/exonuclease/phosphatase family metal-dependent hydrolase n=1 Tax=Sulfitobacter undariae TaxID=1563671 RepID=A0A7W6E163_9RHOB|nr:endonuclease/exonuclease/phosphatase family protein [Sulfitobacter undariae]MBB3992815.1 endonuclease/exonuclease/phosphatase family metal-dependent hydrolase [Sulfitobacter undariae]
MRIASYNIRKAVGLDWRRDPQRIGNILSEIDADIVVLQEADKRLGTRSGVLPLQHLKDTQGYVLADLALRPASHGWHGNAILFKSSLKPTKTQRIDLPTLEPRGAISVQFAEPFFEVVGVHLGLTPGMRQQQLQVLAAYVESRQHPVIIAGDFNERKVHTQLLGPTARVFTPGPSFHAARPRLAFDRFALFGAVQHVTSHVHTSPLSRRASDHLPIVLDMEFPQ